MAKKRVAVLFGGASRDHDVSLMSAFSVLNGLLASKTAYDVIPIGITKAGRWLYFPGDYAQIPDGSWETNPDCCSAVLSPDPLHGGVIKIVSNLESEDIYSLQRVDVVFPVLHGKYGECGQIQALCKLSNISYVGSGFTAANACSDKSLCHLILNRAGINTAKFYELQRVNVDKVEQKFDEIERQINYPMSVKAAVASRSVGANVANNRDELKSAIKLAFSHHYKILVEQAVEGKELECLVWGSVYSINVSPIAEATDNFELVIPAQIEDVVSKEIAEMAKSAFLALGCTDFVRMSFVQNTAGIYCTRVSNMPGFTENDVMAKLMQASGYDYSEMLDMLLENAKEA
ncbi:MAG: ATP-grasp domain-containing protein [Oscillospiraceae bacterium]|nr:ATP-grasp domain-containing protein [Oscillospiraceae bacterium]